MTESQGLPADNSTAAALTANSTGVLNGQVALVTGGTDGIGKECAARLVGQGAQVIVVGRKQDKGERAVKDLQAITHSSNVTFWQYDLSLMSDVKKLTERVKRELPPLNILVQCAGMMLPKRVLTCEGLETVFSVQYLARFLLVRSLVDHFAENVRVVSVSAAGTIPIPLDFNNLNGQKWYNGTYALIHESVANDLFAMRFTRENPQVRFYNYGPFYVKTGLFTDMDPIFKFMTATIGRFVATSTATAGTDIYNLLTGYHPSGMYARNMKEIKPTKYRLDITVQDRLWALSDQMIAGALQTAGD